MRREQLKAIKRLIKNDERYRKLRSAFESSPAFNLNTDAITEEIDDLHKGRTIRNLRQFKSSPGFVDKIVEALLRDQEVRSRLTEILVGCLSSEQRLSEAVSNFKDYALIEYSDQLSNISTKTDRLAVIESCLKPFISYCDLVNRVQIRAKLVVEDIDKSAYTLKNTIEAMKLIVTKGQIV